AGDQAWPPAGLASAVADRFGELGRELAWRAVRPARAVKQTRQRRTRLLSGRAPPVPPAVSRRRRDIERRRRRPQAGPAFDRGDERETASKSELRVTVHRHPSPPLSVSPGRPTASKEGRIEPLAVHNVCRQVN